MQDFIQWLAPILSTIIVTAATASINAHLQRSQKVADERHAETEAKRKAEAEWRSAIAERLDGIDNRLDDIEEKQSRSISQQASQTRSDIVHKCHRYLDDLGRASTEEKEALADEHKQYSEFCDDLGIDNNFIDELVARVMELPEREV